MIGECPICNQYDELRTIEGVTLCHRHLSSVTWERRSTEYPRNRLNAPAIVKDDGVSIKVHTKGVHYGIPIK